MAFVLILAAGLRLAHWWAVRDEPFFAQLAMDSQEYDRWAQAIAGGDWWGSEPFFQAPLYPYLLALVYRLAGHSLDAVYLLQIALAVAGLAALARAADRMLGAPHGLLAAALGALYGPFLFHDVQLLKEGPAVALTSLLLLTLAKLTAEIQSKAISSLDHAAAAKPPGGRKLPLTEFLRTAFLAGVLLGLLVLLRENALLLVPFLAPLAWRRGDLRGSAGRTAALLVGLALVLTPVAARNAALGGGFLPTTFQGGVNFWIGNNAQADGTYRPLAPGRQIPAFERAEPRRIAEAEVGRPLTGAEVSRFWLDRSLAWGRAEPLAFARLALRKLGLYLSGYEWPDAVDYEWTKRRSPVLALPLAEFTAVALLAGAGVLLLILGRRRRDLAALAPVFAFELGWLLATVAFFLFSRYRLPAIPGLLVLAAIPLVELGRTLRAGRRSAALFGTGLVVAVWALPHLADHRPRTDLVEFNLGRLAEERGDRAAAEHHYAAALAAAPDHFLAAMNLGTLAAKRGDLAAALPLLERAAALEPAAPDAAANLGAGRLAAGDLAGARAALERAL
ncbi:MAG: tetratricopeptide repeat protein, partial [Thermoanaerobaculia bacterium]|nr:tetratricopeptide repeat protein [Thermoanaerobaculia bacterium]